VNFEINPDSCATSRRAIKIDVCKNIWIITSWVWAHVGRKRWPTLTLHLHTSWGWFLSWGTWNEPRCVVELREPKWIQMGQGWSANINSFRKKKQMSARQKMWQRNTETSNPAGFEYTEFQVFDSTSTLRVNYCLNKQKQSLVSSLHITLKANTGTASWVIAHIELPAKLSDYFLRSNKSNINQSKLASRGQLRVQRPSVDNCHVHAFITPTKQITD